MVLFAPPIGPGKPSKTGFVFAMRKYQCTL